MLQSNNPFIEPVTIKKGDDPIHIYAHLRNFKRKCDVEEGAYIVSTRIYESSY